MSKSRRGETGSHPFRSGRFFIVNGTWYFATREGPDKGPFASRAAAEAALLNFVRDRGFVHTAARKAAEFKHEQDAEEPTSGHRFYW